MKRDPNISKLIRESGVVPAPGNFTARVMEKIEAVPVKKIYKPLIGRGGLIVFILFVAGVVVLSIVFTDPGKPLLDFSVKVTELNWQLPRLNLHLEFLNRMNLSSVLVSGVVAIFILVLSDALLTRRRLSQ
jgi:hypothetical protein